MRLKYLFWWCLLAVAWVGCSNAHTTDREVVPSASPVLPTATPLPAATPFVSGPVESLPDSEDEPLPLLDIPYSMDAPLNDAEGILDILETLQQREIAWFSRPGWYQMRTGDGSREFGYDVFLTHVIDENRACQEQFHYFLKDGRIWPFMIRLNDGARGAYIPVFEGKLAQHMLYSASESKPCDLGNGAGLGISTGMDDFILHDEGHQFQERLGLQNDTRFTQEFQAWVEEIDGLDAFVLEVDITFPQPSPMVSGVHLEPETGMQYVIERSVGRTYVDLVTGLQLKTEKILYLVDGQIIDFGPGPLTVYEYFEVLPENIAEVYEHMVADVRAALGQ